MSKPTARTARRLMVRLQKTALLGSLLGNAGGIPKLVSLPCICTCHFLKQQHWPVSTGESTQEDTS